jgi:hypothetical protein
MGYACPVCDDPQQDTTHLANHLAFQALTHGDDHESWLDEHAPGWAEGGPTELAPRLAGLASEAEYEVVFEDTTDTSDTDRDGEVYDPDRQGEPTFGHGDDHDHDRGHGHTHRTGGVGVETAELDPEAREVVENARELTREMVADDDPDTGDENDDTADENDNHDTADENDDPDTADENDNHDTADGRE